MQRFKLFIPLIVVVVLGVLFFSVLRDEDYDPQALPSALLNKPMPVFDLPRLESDERVSQLDIRGAHVFDEPVRLRRARNGYDPRPLRQ